MKILSAELNKIPTIGKGEELAGYYEVEIYGLLGKLERHEYAVAHFGTFQRTQNRTVLYSATVWQENGKIYHNYDAEFADDLIALKKGNVALLN